MRQDMKMIKEASNEIIVAETEKNATCSEMAVLRNCDIYNSWKHDGLDRKLGWALLQQVE